MATRDPSRWHSGNTIVIRHVFRGQVCKAEPATVVLDDPDRIAVHVPVGTRMKIVRVDFDAGVLEDMVEYDWKDKEVLKIYGSGESHSVWATWRHGGGPFLGWYVDLLAPVQRFPDGLVTRDQSLDIVVAPDLTWQWKDEDHFARFQELGWMSREEAASVRREADRAIARIERRDPPFCEDWPEWRPDPDWTVPLLPHNWAEVPSGYFDE